MKSPLSPPRQRAGFTILELLLVVSIIVILAALMFPAYNFFKRKAEDAVCMGNLRTLHAGFSSYLQDHQFVWPQNPFLQMADDEGSDSDEAKWWFEQLKGYGPTRETWVCPSERGHWAEVNDPDHFDSTYVPSSFDSTPNIAYRWPRQPWAIERGGFHEKGQANAVFPDGHIDKRMSPGGSDSLKRKK
jgi:prepilin-type N-terminal cleavage/methylation domain-containing protein